jgi:Putative adhesin
MRGISGAMKNATNRHPACPGLPWESSLRSGEGEGPCVCCSLPPALPQGLGFAFALGFAIQLPNYQITQLQNLPQFLRFLRSSVLKVFRVLGCLRGDICFSRTARLPGVAVISVVFLATALASAADSTRQAKLTIAPGGVVSIFNDAGSVVLHQGNGHQVLVRTTTHSDKIEVDANGTPEGKRVEVRVHPLSQQRPTTDESKVDCDITVPAGVSITVSTATAPITVDSLNADLALSSDTGAVTVRNAGNSHISIRSVGSPVVISNVTGGYLEITSSGGSVQLTNVTGPRVQVGTASANISYQGDFAGGGSYILTTHNGEIDVTLPATASVDLTARSISGSVENDFPLQNKSHMTFDPTQGRSFAGTSNSGSSSVELESFSGKIRVKKQ